jgi:NAD+ synthase
MINVDLTINTDVAHRILTGFIRSEVTRVGYSRAVLALSGGIDSALSFALAVEALGKENVLAVRMPYKASSADSLAHAAMLIDQFGTQCETVDITDMVEPLFRTDPEMSRQRKGNIMARQRMIVLYDRSAAFDALVIGTSNKTEALLGYGTLWGDMAAAIQPIGDLYKSQLREVAECLGVPQRILTKPPSADLWPGQTDETELGASYEDLDRVLYALVDRRWSQDRCIRAGLDAALVARVGAAVARMEFKRQVPPVAKLGPRTAGVDYLYPRRRPGSARP